MKNKSSNFLKLAILIFFITSSTIAFSQQDAHHTGFSSFEATYDKFANDFSNYINNKSLIRRLNEKEISGSPYLNSEFVEGTVYTKKNIHYTDIPLRYNIYNDVIEYQLPDSSIYAISNPEIIRKIEIGAETFIYYVTNKGNVGYFSLISSGEVELLSKYNMTFKDAIPSAAFEAAKPPSFNEQADTYFIKVNDKLPTMVAKKKDIKSIFGNQSDQILTYLKKEKLYLRNQADLIKLVNFINELD
jgi:hypothetical protein